MKNAWPILFILAFIACDNPQPQETSGEKIFRTTDPSRLYFRNIRSTHYYHERQESGNMDIYRLRRYSKVKKRPVLRPVIVNNWMQDEAYVLVEDNGFEQIATPYAISVEKDTSLAPVVLTNPGKQGQYDFAASVFKWLREGHDLQIRLKDGGSASLFSNYEDKNNFIMVMNDYYRLTDSYR
ncbi:MAG: hypothetical protein AAF990_28675 [Bacteroidota bacterium]